MSTYRRRGRTGRASAYRRPGRTGRGAPVLVPVTARPSLSPKEPRP
ncbi:hypothetical protein [Streptomyces sp. NPDC047046]